jgi:E3 ubiquitin-protein ligase SHPRH
MAMTATGAAAAGKALEIGHKNKYNDEDQEEMDAMNDGSVQVLLMPLKATNAGLSINEATHVFLLDTGLNRGLEIQALARVRRINSTQTTTVHRLIMQGTIEEAIWNLLRPAHDAAIAASTATASSSSSSDSSSSSTATADATATGEREGSGGGSATQKGGEGMASLAARHQVRRSDVHRMLKKLKYLYHAGGGGKKKESSLQFSGLGVRPEWRERILQGLG